MFLSQITVYACMDSAAINRYLHACCMNNVLPSPVDAAYAMVAEKGLKKGYPCASSSRCLTIKWEAAINVTVQAELLPGASGGQERLRSEAQLGARQHLVGLHCS